MSRHSGPRVLSPSPSIDGYVALSPLSPVSSRSAATAPAPSSHHSNAHGPSFAFSPERPQPHHHPRPQPQPPRMPRYAFAHSHHLATGSAPGSPTAPAAAAALGAHPCEVGGDSGIVAPTPRRSRWNYFRARRPRIALAPSPPPDHDEASNAGEGTALLGSGKWYHGPVFKAGVRLGILFAVFSAIVLGTFWFGMPNVDAEDKPTLKIPRSFEDLKALNKLLHKYKDLYPGRILACCVVAYLYVQAFTLPGSMYLSILYGAAYGFIPAVTLACLCEAFGSLLCYTLSAILAPPLLELPYYRKQLERWRNKIMGDASKGQRVDLYSIFSILVVLRITPFPPHWVCNFVAPHLGIGVVLFWTSAFIGMIPMSVIHVMIGASLDSMTSADDFHILSMRNILGLGAVIVAVLMPMVLKRVFRNEVGDLAPQDAVEAEVEGEEEPLVDVLVDIDDPAHVHHAAVPKHQPYHDADVAPRSNPPSTPTSPRSPCSPLSAHSSKGKTKVADLLGPDSDSEGTHSAYELSHTAGLDGGSSGPRRTTPPREKRTPPGRGAAYGTIDMQPTPRQQGKGRWFNIPTTR